MTESASPAIVTGPESFAVRQDDGLFGPDSVSWQLFIDPSAQLGMVAAVYLQALNPNMMRLFDKTSHQNVDPAGRAQRTGQYVLTTIFGDTAHAEAAGQSVRKMHSLAQWTDPQTGQKLQADNPPWLAWTHNAIVYGVLQAADAYGPHISVSDQDRFVREQFRAAELVGLNPADLPASRSQLDEYIDEQAEWMALTLPAAAAASGLRKPSLRGNPLLVIPNVIIQDGIIALLPEWARELYGVEGRPINLRFAEQATGLMLASARRAKPARDALLSTLADVDAHPYRKIRRGRSAT